MGLQLHAVFMVELQSVLVSLGTGILWEGDYTMLLGIVQSREKWKRRPECLSLVVRRRR